MSNTGKQSPLGVNALSGLLATQGLAINQTTAGYVGSSTAIDNYTYGSLISETVLNKLTSAIRAGWVLFNNGDITSTTYSNLISIGRTTIPALGNTIPPSYTYTGSPGWGGASYTGQIASYGYVRLFPWQAYDEFNYNSTLSIDGKYTDFLGSFISASAFIDTSNSAIMSMQNSLSFLQGTYSNMDDLISSDVSGVSLSTFEFGQDLINLGKALDLSTISTFGFPSNLLATLKRYNAITPSLTLALLATGLTNVDIDQVSNNVRVTTSQQQKIYAAFLIITGVDLAQILIPLNCNTVGLNTLADLLNVKKLFPNSYQSITVPVYNAVLNLPTNSKTYYTIYTDNSVTAALTSPAIMDQIGTIIPPGTPSTSASTTTTIQALPKGFGSYLYNILPSDIATASGAFSMSMQQIKNISNVPIEKFAQVVNSIETTQNLNLINGTNLPTNTDQAQNGLSMIAIGSGPYGTYTYSNFFGCMSGLPYPWMQIQTSIQQLQTSALATIYDNLYTATQTGGDVQIQAQIDFANSEIANILSKYPTQSADLNTLWSNTGTQLGIEQQARVMGYNTLPSPRLTINSYPNVIYSFVDTITSKFAADTFPNMAAQTLEAISDVSNVTGQSIIGLMRSSRNQTRLNIAGIPLDDNISATIPPEQQFEWIGNGVLANSAPAYPNNALGYVNTTTQKYIINNQPMSTGMSVVPGSLAGSPYQNLIPKQLIPVVASSTLPTSQYTVPQAIDNVVLCNCDCWVQ